MSQLFRFLLVGLVNTGFSYFIIFFMMYFFGLSPIASNMIGYSVGLFSSYILNRVITFKSRSKKFFEFTKFVLVFLVSYSVNLFTLYVLIQYTSVNEALAQIISGAVYVLCSYIMNKFIVYRVS